MGVVYKAFDTKLSRTVALKFLPPQWSHDSAAQQRFLREAQAASATNHRNICVIHDFQHTDDGRLFIVMAYYEGQTLKQKLESGALPVGEAVEIACEVAEGLAKAHAQGVVHRDVKSGNLIVSDDGVKILDFGLAKFADALQLTIPGSTIGTVGYMSPEQTRGEEADPRSDVWALGIVLYEMLTGEMPFKGAYPEAIFYAIKNEPVPPLRAPGREIPEALDTIVMRALVKDPEKRYQTAREFARDLRLLLGRTVPLELLTAPLPPLPPLAAPKPLSWWQRTRAAVTPARAIVAAIVATAAVVGAYRWLTRPVVRIPVAIAPVANYTGEPTLDGYRLALTETLLEELEDSPNIRVVPYLRLVEIIRRFIGAGDVSTSEVIQAVAAQSGASVILAPSLEYRNNAWLARTQLRDIKTGTVTKTLETAPITSPLPKDAAQRLMVSLADVLQAEFKANGPGRSYIRRPASSRFLSLDAARAFAEGLAHYEQWEYSAALAEFRRAVSFDDQHPMAHAWLSRTLLVLNQPSEAAGAAKRAKQLITPDLGKSDLLFIDATLAESQNDFDAAGARYAELARSRPDEPAAQLELADFLKRRNRDQEAIGAYREALRLDASYIRPHVDLCQLYTRIDEYPLADEEAKSAAEKYKAVRNSPGEAQALLALSELRRRQGDLTAAKQTAEQAREIFESLRLDYGLSRVYQYLAIVAGYSGDYRMAVRLFEEALSRSRQIGNRRMEVIVLENLGVAHERLGQRARAIEYYQQSHDGYQAIGDERLAAHQEANVASLLIDYGTNQPDALRRLVNAQATFQKLSDIEFEVIAMEYLAVSALHAGRHDEARRRLQQAMTMAKDRRYGNREISMTVRLAESYFATSDYERARKLLEGVAATDAGRDDPEVAVALGKVYIRLGNFDKARIRLESALKAVNATEQLSLLPAVHTTLGELEYESGRLREARAQFEKAGSLWTDDLADAASVEARCHQGSIDTLERKAATAIDMLAAIDRATKMGRLSSEILCRLDLARIHVGQKRFAEALSVLSEISNDGDRTVGRELQAYVHYWRSRALREQGRQSDARTEATQAAKLIREVQESLPEDFRMSFATRRDVSVVTNDGGVQEATGIR
jgi:eukaryotic-like serine/threonine-protein kinase